jgi:hypothetical protein
MYAEDSGMVWPLSVLDLDLPWGGSALVGMTTALAGEARRELGGMCRAA